MNHLIDFGVFLGAFWPKRIFEKPDLKFINIQQGFQSTNLPVNINICYTK